MNEPSTARILAEIQSLVHLELLRLLGLAKDGEFKEIREEALERAQLMLRVQQHVQFLSEEENAN